MVQLKLYLLLNAIYLSAIGASVSTSECLVPCPKIMAPLCAFDGEIHKIFDNDCLLQKRICEDGDVQGRKWVLLSMDQCHNSFTSDEASVEDCFYICDETIDPICAMKKDTYRIFPNYCEMQQANCDLDKGQWNKVNLLDCFKAEKYRRDKLKNCQKPCSRLYNPICAFDGEELKVFGNSCNLEVENCINNNKWQLTGMRKCMHNGLLDFVST